MPPPAGALEGYHLTAIEGWHDDFGLLMRQSWGPTAKYPNFRPWGIDHPLAGVDSRFAHLVGKRGYGWLPYGWIKTGYVFEPAYFTGKLELE